MIGFRVIWWFILLKVFLIELGLCEEKEGGHIIGFNDGMKQCENYENNVMVADNMVLAKSSEDGEDNMCLEGHMDIKEDITEGTMIEIEIAKETELGSEPMWSSSMDLCKSLDDKDAPWAEALKNMNITGCPIKTGKYYCDTFILDMSFMNDKLNHEWEGSYLVLFTLLNSKAQGIACHMLGLAIVPTEERK